MMKMTCGRSGFASSILLVVVLVSSTNGPSFLSSSSNFFGVSAAVLPSTLSDDTAVVSSYEELAGNLTSPTVKKIYVTQDIVYPAEAPADGLLLMRDITVVGACETSAATSLMGSGSPKGLCMLNASAPVGGARRHLAVIAADQSSPGPFKVHMEDLAFTGGAQPAAAGGVMYITGSDGTASFKTCGFLKNSASNGGVLYSDAGTTVPVFEKCQFHQNMATGLVVNGAGWGGAAMFTMGRSAKFVECGFVGNVANDRAGAVYQWQGTNVEYHGCDFDKNKAGSATSTLPLGGAVVVDGANATFMNTNVDDNTPTGIHLYGEPSSPAFAHLVKTNVDEKDDVAIMTGVDSAAQEAVKGKKLVLLNVATYKIEDSQTDEKATGDGEKQMMMFGTEEEAKAAAEKMGCSGAHKMGDKWMVGDTHDACTKSAEGPQTPAVDVTFFADGACTTPFDGTPKSATVESGKCVELKKGEDGMFMKIEIAEKLYIGVDKTCEMAQVKQDLNCMTDGSECCPISADGEFLFAYKTKDAGLVPSPATTATTKAPAPAPATTTKAPAPAPATTTKAPAKTATTTKAPATAPAPTTKSGAFTPSALVGVAALAVAALAA